MAGIILRLLCDRTISGVQFAQFLQTRPSQEYDCEDTTRAIFSINNNKLAIEKGIISCSIFISRLGPTERSQLTIYGESSSLRLEIDSEEVHLTNRSKTKGFGNALVSELIIYFGHKQLIVNACRIESTAVPADDEDVPCETY